MDGLSSALGSIWAWITYTFDPFCGPVGVFRLLAADTLVACGDAGWGDDIANLKRMAATFEKELASMGVDIEAMKKDLASLAEQVGRAEESGKLSRALALAAEQVTLLHAGPGFAPVEEGLGLLGPEDFRLLDRLLVKTQVVVVVQVGALAHCIGHGVAGDFEHGGSLLLCSAMFVG